MPLESSYQSNKHFAALKTHHALSQCKVKVPIDALPLTSGGELAGELDAFGRHKFGVAILGMVK